MITIFTDGSSKGNPGPGGWAAILADDNRVVEIGGHSEHTTNNKMELTAAIKAVQFLIMFESEGNIPPATIYSDATYVVRGITEWIHGWHRNNWKTASKKPVENKELWMELFEATQGKHLTWKLVAGHAGVAANERCDEIATTFADRTGLELYDGPRNKYLIPLKA